MILNLFENNGIEKKRRGYFSQGTNQSYGKNSRREGVATQRNKWNGQGKSGGCYQNSRAWRIAQENK